MSDEEEQRNRHTERLTNHLHRLSIKLQNTSEQLQQLQGTPSNQHNPQENKSTRASGRNQQQQHQQPWRRQSRQQQRIRELQVGDRVLITNNHRGARGVIGTIVRVTPATVLIDPDKGGLKIRKYKKNVVYFDQE